MHESWQGASIWFLLRHNKSVMFTGCLQYLKVEHLDSPNNYFSCLMSKKKKKLLSFSSVAQSCLTLCDPMDRGMPGLPVHHQLLESTQTHVHWVSDVIQPSHSLSSPSPPALNPSQHQGLFKWVSFSHQAAKGLVSVSTSILPVNTQDWSTLGWTGWISLQSWRCVNVDLCENLLMITFTILIMRIGRFIMRSLKLSNIFGNSLASE